MKRHILLPTDFSDNAWSAVVYALKMYAEEECTFYFLHATKMKVSTMSNMTNKLQSIINKNAMKELSELKSIADTSNANTNHDFEIILSPENLKSAIEIAVKRHNINLVIIGAKGSTGAKEFFFGSNTVKIIKNTRFCPVLVVPEGYEFVKPKQIAFPTNFKRFYEDKELESIRRVADLHNSKIRVVYINDEDHLDDIQEYNLNMLKSYLGNYEHSFHWIPNYSKKVVEINDFIEELEIDILAMVNYKHSFIESIIKEPTIKKIGYHPMIPFLVIPE